MTLLDIISIFVVLANLSLGLFVFIKGPRKKANIFFFLLTIAIAGWVFTNWISVVSRDYLIVLYYGRITFVAAALIMLFFVIFFLNFPTNFIINKKIKILLLFIGLLFSFLSLTNLVQKDVKIKLPFNDLIFGPVYPVYFIYILIYFLIGIYILIKQFRKLKGIVREKIKYVIAGFLISAIIGITTNLLMVLLGPPYRINLSPYGPLFTIVMVIFMAYSILRYRLMDIKIVIRKGVVHILSFIILLFIYIYILIYLQKYLTQQYRWPEQTGIIILVLLIVITVEPLRRFLFRIIDQVFYARKKEAREKAKRLKIILSSSLEFDKLINKVKNELQDFLEVGDIQFVWHNKKTGRLENYYEQERKVVINPTEPLFNYLQERPEIIVAEEIPYLMEERSASEADVLKNIEKKLNDLGIALIWPVGEKGELIGAFLVGQKAKKEAFTSENLQYLSNIQFQTTMAVANALLYKQAVERIATFQK